MGLRGIGSFPLSRRGTDTNTPAPETELTERGFFTTEMIELFAELERRPDGHLPYGRPDSHRLAGLLGLLPQWLKSCHVNDRSPSSGYPSGHLTDVAFWRTREVREALLAAVAERAGQRVRRRRRTVRKLVELAPAEQPEPAA